MPNKSIYDLRFPLAGLDRARAYKQQPPYTTPDALNVRPDGISEGRERGGSRPGLDIAVRSLEPGGSSITDPVRGLGKVSVVETLTGYKTWSDDFRGSSLNVMWNIASWALNDVEVTGGNAVVDNGNITAYVRDDLTDLDTTQEYLLEIRPVPLLGVHNCTYTIYLRMDSDVAYAQDSTTVNLTITPSGAYGATIVTYSGGAITDSQSATGGNIGYDAPGWFTVKVNANTLTLYWRDATMFTGTIPAAAGQRFGFGMNAGSNINGAGISDFRIQYFQQGASNSRRDLLVAVAGGEVWYENYVGELKKATGLTLNPNAEICMADWKQKLYLADYGDLDNGTDGILQTDLVTFTAADGTDFAALGVDSTYVLTISRSDLTVNEIQRVTLSNTDGGTFTLSFNSNPTGTIAFDAVAADVKAALEALADIDEVTVVGPAVGPWDIEFTGEAVKETNQPLLVGNADALTYSGAGTPTVGVTETQRGQDETAIAGTYDIASVATTTITLSTGPTGIAVAAPITGIHYRIDRPPKVFDPDTGIVSALTATSGKGSVPIGNRLVIRYRDMIMFGGPPDNPHMWYHSRQGDVLDWDYTQIDTQSAAAGTNADAGVPGEPIVAMMPHADECVMFGCVNSLWIMRGSPSFGGQIDVLSEKIGIVGPKAFCRLPGGETCFLSQDGLYIQPAGCHGIPTSMGRERIPNDLVNIDPETTTAVLEWDRQERGIHIFVTREESTAGSDHYWFDWETKSWWPVRVRNTHEPLSIHAHNSFHGPSQRVILGCRDGSFREFRPDFEKDDNNTDIDSYVVYGPFSLSRRSYHEGVVTELIGVLSNDSDSVVWELAVGESHEQAYKNTARESGTWTRTGLNYKVRARVRGPAATLKVSNGSIRPWTLEHIQMVVRSGGKLRVRSDRVSTESVGSVQTPPIVAEYDYAYVDNDGAVYVDSDGATYVYFDADETPVSYEGFGAAATGGAGGDTYDVINTNSSGAGSFYNGVMSATGPRTITFSVSGWIDLTGFNVFTGIDNITVDGSTAPAGGIGFRNKTFSLQNATNWIIKHIRCKLGDQGPAPYDNADAFSLSVVDTVVVDHCSFTWGIDETSGNISADNVTFVDCILAEGLDNTGLHSKNPHSMTFQVQNSLGFTLQRCLLCRSVMRHPVFNTGTFQLANNVMYDWTSPAYPVLLLKDLPVPVHPTCDVNIESNYFKRGPNTISVANRQVSAQSNSRPYYDNGNVSVGEVFDKSQPTIPWTIVKHDFPALNLLDADAAYAYVLANAGATLPKRDTHDQSIIDHVTNGTGTTPIDSQADVGGWPDLTV